MKRHVAMTVAPLADVLIFCSLKSHGYSLLTSHVVAFGAAIILNYSLKVRAIVAERGQDADWRLYLQLLVVALLALFLRGGVLASSMQSWAWPALPSIILAVIAGHGVLWLGYHHVLSPADPDLRWQSLAMRLIAYALALKMVYLGATELLPEEAYYWNYSQHLDLSYLDHPPLVAWLGGIGTFIFGHSEFGVRIGALCCGLVTSLFTYRLTRNLAGREAALGALVLVQILPFFFLSGLLLTPDAPLTAAWAGSLYFLERALVAGVPRAWWRAGITLGLGLISKYSIGLLAPVVATYMLVDSRARRWWRHVEPYLAVLIAALIFAPVLIWNAEHDWASFAFQTSRRLAETPRFQFHKLLGSILVLITPTGAVAIAVSLWKPRLEAARGWLLLRLAVLVPLSVLSIFSLRHEVKLDWSGALWTAALPALSVGMSPAMTWAGARGFGARDNLRDRIRAAWPPTLLIVLLMLGAGLHYLTLGLPGVGYSKHIELVPVGWRDLSRQVTATAASIRQRTGRDPLIVGMDRYALASELAFYGGSESHARLETSSGHLFEGIGLMYERWTPPVAEEGRDLLLISWDAQDLEGTRIESHAERLGPIEVDVLMKNGKIILRYYQRVAYSYRSHGLGG